MKNLFNYIIIICLIFALIRFTIEYIRYKKAPNQLKVQVSYRAYPFLIISNILFIILALIELLIRIGFFIK